MTHINFTHYNKTLYFPHGTRAILSWPPRSEKATKAEIRSCQQSVFSNWHLYIHHMYQSPSSCRIQSISICCVGLYGTYINKVCSLICTLTHKYTMVLSDNVDGGEILILLLLVLVLLLLLLLLLLLRTFFPTKLRSAKGFSTTRPL
jgi:hypothetical protein